MKNQLLKMFVVGIAGGSASGKTTFCSLLSKECQKNRVFEIHLDDNHPDTVT